MDGLIRSLTHPVADAWRRPACLVLGVLTACFVLASAIGVRTDLAARDRALQTMLDALPASSRSVVLDADYSGFVDQNLGPNALEGTAASDAALNKPIAAALAQQTQTTYTVLASSAPNIPIAPQASAWSSIGTPTYYVGTYAAQPRPIYPGQPEIQFTYLQNAAQRARLVAGRWPKNIGPLRSGIMSVEVALSTATLARYGLHVGSDFLAQSGGSLPPPPLAIVVTGAYQPLDPSAAYWQDQPSDLSPQWVRAANLPAYQLGGGLFGQDELAALEALQPFGLQGLTVETHVPLQTASLTASQVDGLITAVEAGLSQAGANLENQDGYGGSGNQFRTLMLATLAQFSAEQQAGQLETAMPAVTLVLLGLIALLVAARAAVDRTSAQTAVQRARGAPLRRLAGAAARDAALTVVPLTVAAVVIAALIPGRSPARLWMYELVLPLTAVAGPAVLTALRHRRTGAAALTTGVARARALPRRLVGQAACLVLCLFGLAEARAEGSRPAEASTCSRRAPPPWRRSWRPWSC